MIDAIVGALVITVATAALALAVEFSEQAFAESGFQPLSQYEREVLLSPGFSEVDIDVVNSDLQAHALSLRPTVVP
jgi:hypothetical protein